MIEWFAGSKEKSKKATEPKKLLEGLRSVRQEAMINFNWGLRFGRLEKLGFKFNHGGDPFNYPTLEFEELKTLAMAFFTSKDQREYEMKRAPADIAAALNIPNYQREQAKKLSQGMANFFKGPLA